MKILFIQLPLLDFGYNYIQGNIEYAGASIAGYILKRHPEIHIETLPFLLSNFGSDEMIIRYVEKTAPDIIAFSNYLWNVERHLFLSKKIKRRMASVKIIFGGPEINNGTIAWSSEKAWVDYFVKGEGEWFFHRWLSAFDFTKESSTIKKNRIITQPEAELIPSDEIFEPLSGKRLDLMPDGSTFFELTRGCPYRCAYCLYSKNYPCIREISFSMLMDTLELMPGLSEIYILSPTLDRTDDFHSRLKQLAGKNKSIKLHSEMRTDRIDKKTAKLLYDAGFRSLEVGLQTLNKQALRQMNRAGDTEKEIQGMMRLKEAGIDLKIGIIPGLPGDDVESFCSTIDRLVEEGFEENIEFYPLMILPGTTLRDRAVSEKITYQQNPPYFYQNGWGIDFNGIKDISAYLEQRTGYSHVPSYLPDFISDSSGLLTKGIKMDGSNPDHWKPERYQQIIETNVFSFFIYNASDSGLMAGLSKLIQGLPDDVLFNFILYTNQRLNENNFIKKIWKYEKDNYYRRMHYFDDWSHGLIWRVFQVFDDLDCYIKYGSYEIIVPIFKVSENNYQRLFELDFGDINLLVLRDMYTKIERLLKEKYSENPEAVVFELESDQAKFFSMIGMEHVSYPFMFKIL